MSTDAQRPEHVTLTDEEWGGAHWRLFREHRPVGGYPVVGQMDGDCHACGGSWPCLPVREALAERDAAREKALREEIKADLLAKCPHVHTSDAYAEVCEDCGYWIVAARIARGETR